MYEILTIILGIFGVLQIILFFKLWGMTNNVKNLNEIASATDKRDFESAKIETLLGNYNEAYNIYKKCFIMEVFKLYKNCDMSDTFYEMYYKELVIKYQKRIDSLEGKFSIDFDKYNTNEKMLKLIL